MKVASSVLRDVGLLLLAVVTVAAAAYVLLREPGEAAAPLAPVVARSAEPAPAPDAVEALFLGGDLLLGEAGLADVVAEELGWDVTVDAVPGTGYVTGDAAQTYGERLAAAVAQADPDVVVLVSSADEAEAADGALFGGSVQKAVSSVRAAAPEAQVVLVGPALPQSDAAAVQRAVLTQVAARFGAFYLDPTGRGYLADRPELLAPDGSLTPEGAGVVARRMAADLRVVLPRPLLPSASPTP